MLELKWHWVGYSLVEMSSFHINPFEFFFFFCLDNWMMDNASSRDAYRCIQTQLLTRSRLAFPLTFIFFAKLPDLQKMHYPISSIREQILSEKRILDTYHIYIKHSPSPSFPAHYNAHCLHHHLIQGKKAFPIRLHTEQHTITARPRPERQLHRTTVRFL